MCEFRGKLLGDNKHLRKGNLVASYLPSSPGKGFYSATSLLGKGGVWMDDDGVVSGQSPQAYPNFSHPHHNARLIYISGLAES